LQGVVIFVSQQLGTSRIDLHQKCISLGGKFVWVFDVPFTHYICQVSGFAIRTKDEIIVVDWFV
jgi:hypothetical protein